MNKYKQNKTTAQDERARMLQLMNYRPATLVAEQKEKEGKIERHEVAKNGKVYAIIKENNKYYLKVAPKKDNITLNDYEYFGGAQRYKNLYEYSSYSHAEKILNEELASVNRRFTASATEPVLPAKYENNVLITESTKTMREEIERQREIMVNVGKITGEHVNIENTKLITEMSIDDKDTMLTDNQVTEGDDEVDIPIELDGVSPDETDIDIDGEGDLDIELDDEEPVDDDDTLDQEDIDLDKQNIELNIELQDEIETLMDKMDDMSASIDDVISGNINPEGGVSEIEIDLDGDDLGAEEGFEGGEEFTDGEFDEGIGTPDDVYFDEEDERTFGEWGKRENGLGECGLNPVRETEEFIWDYKGENINDHGGDVIKDKVTEGLKKGRKILMVFEGGEVIANLKRKPEDLSNSDPKVTNDPDKPFEEVVKQITEEMYRSMVVDGQIRKKKQ
jgi:hypothetical protein